MALQLLIISQQKEENIENIIGILSLKQNNTKCHLKISDYPTPWLKLNLNTTSNKEDEIIKLKRSEKR